MPATGPVPRPGRPDLPARPGHWGRVQRLVPQGQRPRQVPQLPPRQRRGVETERGEENVEIMATLIATSIVPKELDAVVEALEKLPGVEHATWESSAQN